MKVCFYVGVIAGVLLCGFLIGYNAGIDRANSCYGQGGVLLNDGIEYFCQHE